MSFDWASLSGLFLVGTTIGSFLSVVVYRLPRELSLWTRSQCIACGHTIPWYKNVPIWGYFISGARCNSCGSVVALRYLALEITGGLVPIGFFVLFGPSYEWMKFSILTFLLIAVSFIDYDFQMIPDSLNIFGTVTGLALATTAGSDAFAQALIGGLIAAGTFALIRSAGSLVFRKEAMGLGDVKLAAVLGIFLGVKSFFIAVFITFVLLAAIGWTRILFNRQLRNQSVPMAPYLAVGTLLSVLVGASLLNWYLALYHTHR